MAADDSAQTQLTPAQRAFAGGLLTSGAVKFGAFRLAGFVALTR